LRREAFALLGIAILVCSPAFGQVAPTENTALGEGARMQYHAVISYSSTDARVERQSADADGSGSVNDSEAQNYEGRQAAMRLGNATSNLRWDGARAVWAEVSVTAEKFANRNFNSAFSLVLDGVLDLTPAAGPNHTLTISNLTGFSNYSFSLTVSANWSIVDVAGVFVTFVSSTAVSGDVDPTSLAIIQVTESPAAQRPDIGGLNLALLAEVARMNATLLEEIARTNSTLFSALAAQDARLTASLAAQNASLLASLAAQNSLLLQAIALSNGSLIEELARVNSTLRDELTASNGQLWSALNQTKESQASALAATQSGLEETNATLARARADVGAANGLALIGTALGIAGMAVGVAAILTGRRTVKRAGGPPMDWVAGEDFEFPPEPGGYRGHSMAAEAEIGGSGDTDQ
jgi:hypothetical protein